MYGTRSNTCACEIHSIRGEGPSIKRFRQNFNLFRKCHCLKQNL